MKLNSFLSICLPYCLDKQSNGKFVALNRNYKPIGFLTADWIKFEEFPIAAEIPGLLKEKNLEKVSVKRESGKDRIYLYDDATNPTKSTENMKSYLAKIETLAKLEVS